MRRDGEAGKACFMTAMVAVACCRRLDDSDPTDLYPDLDAGPLRAALADLGVDSTLVSWDDPGVDWGSFSQIVISSTWDSVDRPIEYLAWAGRVADASVLVNSLPVIQWNLDKIHQRQLEAAGVPIIPTTWVGVEEVWSPPGLGEGDFVVKPSISAGGRNTARYAGGDPAAVDHVQALQRAGQIVMVQDHLAAIDEEGEVDLIFFDGRFSHAVLKKPVLRVGEGVVDQPWERMAWTGLVTPTQQQVAVAMLTMSVVSDRFVGPPAYGRVDLISGPSGAPLVLEVELIDPYLSLDMEPAAATTLAKAVLHR
jgi:hypothetical protein